ncbi:CHAP domain-containing protein [Breznakia sp. OttesenSCG-928-G09]|nr:CHAP domain-containing protein [Breznakia sp. OttesenSCG-928-G09]
MKSNKMKRLKIFVALTILFNTIYYITPINSLENTANVNDQRTIIYSFDENNKVINNIMEETLVSDIKAHFSELDLRVMKSKDDNTEIIDGLVKPGMIFDFNSKNGAYMGTYEVGELVENQPDLQVINSLLSAYTPHQFYLDTIGKSIDYDGAAGAQCVDLFKMFLSKTGHPNPKQALGGSGGAKEIWYKRAELGYLSYFTETSISQMKDGDWVIWGGTTNNPYGHVAMFRKGVGSNTGIFLNQNYNFQPFVSQNELSYSGIIGVLRPKIFNQTAPPNPQYPKPELINKKVININHTGYTVTFDIKNASSIKSIACSSWNVLNGQDDLITKSVAFNASSLNTRINISDHSSKSGNYLSTFKVVTKDNKVYNYALDNVVYVPIFAEEATVNVLSQATSCGNNYWHEWKDLGETAGTTTKNINNFRMCLETNLLGNLKYQVSSTNLDYWHDWKYAGEEAKTSSTSVGFNKLRISLTGQLDEEYDIYYRVYTSKNGWQGWAMNGETAGVAGNQHSIQGIQFYLVDKGGEAPGLTAGAYDIDVNTEMKYQAKSAGNAYWDEWQQSGNTAGTTTKNINSFRMSMKSNLTGDLKYQVGSSNLDYWHVWKTAGEEAMSNNEGIGFNKIRMQVTSELGFYYDIYYRIYTSENGWQGWAKNGETAGIANDKFSIQGIQVKLVEKGGESPGITEGAFDNKKFLNMRYQGKTIGNNYWHEWKELGETAGTTTKGMNTFRTMLRTNIEGNLKYQIASNNLDYWHEWKYADYEGGEEAKTSSTTAGFHKLRMTLTENLADEYDIYYRIYTSKYGWQGWAKNGETAGIADKNYSVRGIQVKVITKGDSAPGLTTGAYK